MTQARDVYDVKFESMQRRIQHKVRTPFYFGLAYNP